jgi:peptidoglycan hydrolase-like protein with peptidoglycan-binding domain
VTRARPGALALAAALGAALAGCGGVRRVPDAEPEPGAASGKAKVEQPDRPSDRGVEPKGDRPRIPAAPEALLAEGAIGDLQAALASRGLLGEHRRGELDDATSRALRRFQEQEGLAATGFPDRETLSRLGVEPDRAYGRDR